MGVISQGTFYNPTKGQMSLPQVVQELISYLKEKPERNYEIIVGCDSSAVEEPTFPVVVVVLRKKEGGRFFLTKVHYPAPRKFYNLHDRILEEVLLSCQLAQWLRENFVAAAKKADLKVPYELQYIHADVGENGATRDMIKEVTGLIRGNGFIPMVKPESFAASAVADRFT
ncbi:MAG: ribonuclease H-like YkuK family protein [bacterium]|nr:ribonuclease H-like YkuK family protein [bacterium]